MHFVNAKGILSAKNGMNIYRGCTHGCIYCDSRSLCYNMTHDFDDIEVKQNAPLLLTDALRRKRTKCMIGSGSMCDPYMPCENELKLTRKCLEIINAYGFGATVITKSNNVMRDLDLFCEINKKAKAVLQMTVTTSDAELCSIIEPFAPSTEKRFETLKTFSENGIPTVLWLSPILPFINDTEKNIKNILDCCFDAKVKGILCFGMGTTIRMGSREFFYAALDKNFSGIKQKYINTFGTAYECLSPNNAQLMRMFNRECEKHGVMHNINEIFSYLNEFPKDCEGTQLSLF